MYIVVHASRPAELTRRDVTYYDIHYIYRVIRL